MNELDIVVIAWLAYHMLVIAVLCAVGAVQYIDYFLRLHYDAVYNQQMEDID